VNGWSVSEVQFDQVLQEGTHLSFRGLHDRIPYEETVEEPKVSRGIPADVDVVLQDHQATISQKATLRTI
jgi:hypothetical protein